MFLVNLTEWWITELRHRAGKVLFFLHRRCIGIIFMNPYVVRGAVYAASHPLDLLTICLFSNRQGG